MLKNPYQNRLIIDYNLTNIQVTHYLIVISPGHTESILVSCFVFRLFWLYGVRQNSIYIYMNFWDSVVNDFCLDICSDRSSVPFRKSCFALGHLLDICQSSWIWTVEV